MKTLHVKLPHPK